MCHVVDYEKMNNEKVFQGKRLRMVNSLKNKGIIRSKLVYDAMNRVAREKFMSFMYSELAYEDNAYRIDAEQTISQPSTVAKQTELLNLKGGEKIMEIGTGSGYQTAVLCECGCNVFSIERQKTLYEKTTELLKNMGYNPHCRHADGFLGWRKESPFDAIIITAGCDETPNELLKQVKVGGVVVVPLKKENEFRMVRITKCDDDLFFEDFGNCTFVPMLHDVE